MKVNGSKVNGKSPTLFNVYVALTRVEEQLDAHLKYSKSGSLEIKNSIESLRTEIKPLVSSISKQKVINTILGAVGTVAIIIAMNALLTGG